LRSGRQRVRLDLRHAEGQGRSDLADYRPRSLAIETDVTSMDRRHFLKTGGIALAGFGLAGCGPKTVHTAPARQHVPRVPPRPAFDLTPPRITWERVIRTTIGLRPHRDSGFVLKAVKFDDKTVIHDYGFGGAGMSLAWGCGAMAAEMALEQGDRRAAVLGCG